MQAKMKMDRLFFCTFLECISSQFLPYIGVLGSRERVRKWNVLKFQEFIKCEGYIDIYPP